MVFGRSLKISLVAESQQGSFRTGNEVKRKFHGKMAWGLMTGLTRQGLTAKAAIGRIYSTYGVQTIVTMIRKPVKFDKSVNALILV